MAELFAGESAGILRMVAAALRSGQLAIPISRMALSRVGYCTDTLFAELIRLSTEGMTALHLALLLDTAAGAAEARLNGDGTADLVWTGPESLGSHSRDTAVVLDEMFRNAQRTVLVSTFVVRQGGEVFKSLAGQMDIVPGLKVRLFLHVPRGARDTRDDSELLREFSERFQNEWPGARRLEVFYDPRTISRERAQMATWHAKCVVVDEELAFVTSANFTEWAQGRNVEAGVLVRNRHFAEQLLSQFEALVQSRQVRRLPGW